MHSCSERHKGVVVLRYNRLLFQSPWFRALSSLFLLSCYKPLW